MENFLGFDPFEESRRVTRRATEPAPQPRLPSGFTELPGGNLMYAVADDPEKLYAQASAEYEARVRNPRINGLDSPDRLYKELFAPLDAVYRSNANVTPGRIVETPNGIVNVDPHTLQVTDVMKYPQKPEPELSPVEKIEYSDLLAKRRAIEGGLVGQALASKGEPNPALEAVDREIESYRAKIAAKKNTEQPQVSVAAKVPQLYFGPVTDNPFSGQPQTTTATNAPGVVRTKSGKTYKITSP